MKTAPTKQLDKRGRKPGSTDTVFVSIESLLKHAKPSTIIPVRRKWVEQFEAFNNVRFEDAGPEIVSQRSEVNLTEEPLGAARDAVVRTRIEFAEEEL